MSALLGYQGKRIVITGAASGMGQAAAHMLSALGAQVYALDIAPVTTSVYSALMMDMQDAASIDAGLQQLPDRVDALFNCAGVPSPPFSAEETVLINFCGMRYLTEKLLPRMTEGGAIASIASTAGMGWRNQLDSVKAFLALEPDFESARAWMVDNPEVCADGYGFSKQCMIVYTMQQAAVLAGRGIRINAISPSPTASGFMDKLTGEGQMPTEAIDLFLPANGRYASGAEMAQPLVWLNSAMAQFVSGVNLPVDFGYCAEVFIGTRDNLLNIS